MSVEDIKADLRGVSAFVGDQSLSVDDLTSLLDGHANAMQSKLCTPNRLEITDATQFAQLINNGRWRSCQTSSPSYHTPTARPGMSSAENAAASTARPRESSKRFGLYAIFATVLLTDSANSGQPRQTCTHNGPHDEK